MIIIPSGTGWREARKQQAKVTVDSCVSKDIPVAAICDATTFLGSHGYLDHHKHTGNTLYYWKQGAPNYKGDAHYIECSVCSRREFDHREWKRRAGIFKAYLGVIGCVRRRSL